jgi:nucleotide-binding universal stress UspA family protein
MAENLAKETGSKLRAVTVIPSAEHKAEADLVVEKGEAFLREYWTDDVFSIKEGDVTNTILDYAKNSQSLLVLGAYGYGDPDKNVLGSTTSNVIRQAQNSLLVYRPPLSQAKRKENKKMSRVFA